MRLILVAKNQQTCQQRARELKLQYAVIQAAPDRWQKWGYQWGLYEKNPYVDK